MLDSFSLTYIMMALLTSLILFVHFTMCSFCLSHSIYTSHFPHCFCSYALQHQSFLLFIFFFFFFLSSSIIQCPVWHFEYSNDPLIICDTEYSCRGNSLFLRVYVSQYVYSFVSIFISRNCFSFYILLGVFSSNSFYFIFFRCVIVFFVFLVNLFVENISIYFTSHMTNEGMRRAWETKASETVTVEWFYLHSVLIMVGLKIVSSKAYITWHFSLILALEPSPPSCETPPFARSFFFGLDFLFFLPSNCSDTVRVFSIFSNSYIVMTRKW